MLLDILIDGTDNLAVRLLSLLILFPALLFSLSCHEYAHGFAAMKQGDYYAKSTGRLTLNPFAHIDPAGALMMLLVGFGWAKPVPIVPTNFKNGRKSMLIVAFAGVFTNLILAIISVFFYYFFGYIVFAGVIASSFAGVIGTVVLTFFYYLAVINLNLAVFNLIPIPPLDGYKIFKELTIGKINYVTFAKIERYSTFILIAFLILSNRINLISAVSGVLYDGISYLIHFIFIAFI